MDKKLEYFKGDALAADIWQSKYAYEGEETPDDMHRRLAREFARADRECCKGYRKDVGKISDLGEQIGLAPLEEEDIFQLFKDFKYIVPQGSVMSQLGTDAPTSISNCFVIGEIPEDSYGGICKTDQELVQIMKRRGGVGIDISTLRPYNTPVSNAAKTSTGAVSFMERFSHSTREVAQNGRRGALMISMAIEHPDILEFIKIKRNLDKVTGANISVKVSDAFMEAVIGNKDFYLRFPTNIPFFKSDLQEDLEYDRLYSAEELPTYKGKAKYVRRVSAKKYWEEFVKSAHGFAEPGVMYWDTMVSKGLDGSYNRYRPVTTNPCSEIGMGPYDACRLMAINLLSFVENPFEKNARFNLELFSKVTYIAMRLSDLLVDLEIERIKRIRHNVFNPGEDYDICRIEDELWRRIRHVARDSRRTGLGFTGLGDVFAALNMRYGSEESLAFTERLMKTKLAAELDCTIDRAALLEPFWKCDIEREHDPMGIQELFPEIYKRMRKYGRRNVSFSTVAPTGTVSLMTQTTSGIEPLFMPYYMRRKKVNPGDKNVRVDFVDQVGDSFQEFAILHPQFKNWILKKYPDIKIDELKDVQLQGLFEQSPWCMSTAPEIDWETRVRLQGIIQKYTTHSISSTINLPEDISEEIVSNIYLEAWRQKLKGITVYRDGSRSGILVSKEQKKSFTSLDAVERPKILPCHAHLVRIKGKSYTVLVGILSERPYEVFITEQMIKKSSKSKYAIEKLGKGKYSLKEGNKEIIPEIITLNDTELEVIMRMISISLRHGVDVKFIVEQISKSCSHISAPYKAISRVLKTYIENGSKSTFTCESCGGENVIFEEGCTRCLDCGETKCS